MRIPLALAGCALIAYPVYAAVGLGLSLCVFFGLACLMAAIGLWFDDTAKNTALVLERAEDNYFILERLLRK